MIYKFIFECIVISFHRCYHMGNRPCSYSASYLLNCKFIWMYIEHPDHCDERTSLSGFIASTLVILFQLGLATTDLSYISMMLQLYLLLPFVRNKYVKSVHHILFLFCEWKFCFSKLENILLKWPFEYTSFSFIKINSRPRFLFIYLCTVILLSLISFLLKKEFVVL